jgi:hypothetical protein
LSLGGSAIAHSIVNDPHFHLGLQHSRFSELDCAAPAVIANPGKPHGGNPVRVTTDTSRLRVSRGAMT